MVKILIGNFTSNISGYLPDEVNYKLNSVLAYKINGIEHSDKVKKGYWDGYFRLYYKNKGQSFYSGLVSLVIEILKQNNIKYQICDMRVRPEENLCHLEFSPPPKYVERDYQQFAIDKSLTKTRGILKMATGSGKTMCCAELISRIKTAPFMFYVLTKDLLDQAYDTFASTLNEPIGRIGGGYFDVKNINVCTVQTVIRAVNMNNSNFKISDYAYDDEDKGSWDDDQINDVDKLSRINRLLLDTKGIIVDEAHHAASKTIIDVVSASPKAFWRYGATATPYREDGADILLQSMFGQKLVDISATYLIDKEFLVPPYIFFERINHDVDFHSWQSIYSNCITKNDDFNSHVAATANHLISRGLTVLILVQQYAQGEFIKKLIPNTEFVTGKMTTNKRKESIEDLRQQRVKCMIATTLADEGLDVPSLDAVLLAGGGASATRIYQRIGRVLRPNKNAVVPKTKAIVIYYDHNAKYLDKHTAKARKIIKAEPAFNIIKSKGSAFINQEIDHLLGFSDEVKSIFDKHSEDASYGTKT